MIWPFNRIAAWLEWRRRSREETIIATMVCVTNYVDANGKRTGESAKHIVEFCADGNGRRYSRVQSNDQFAAERHDGILQLRSNWRVHGALHERAQRVQRCGSAQIVLIRGGAA